MIIANRDPYLTYYYNQQSGSGVGTVFRGSAQQRGHGVGSFLGGMFRTIAPLFKTVGKEALRSGVGFLSDIAAGTASPKTSASSRLKQFTGTLKRKADEKMDRILTGGGVKRRRRTVRKKRKVTTTTKRRRLTGGGGRTSTYKKKRRVTPQSIRALLGRRTSQQQQRRRKSKVTLRKDIFG